MRRTFIVSAGLVLLPVAVAVGPQLGMLRGSIGVEAEWTLDGDFYDDGVSTIADMALLGPAYAGESAELQIRRASYDDVVEQPSWGARAELAYGVDDNIEVYGAFTWSRMADTVTQFGDIVVANGDVVPMTASFDESNSYGLEAGARYYFDTESYSFRPFVGASVGAMYREGQRMRLEAWAAGVDIDNILFRDDTTYLTAGAEAGVVFGDGYTWSGSLSVGLKYATALDDGETELGAYGLSSITENTDTLTMPVRGSVSFSF